MTAMRIFLRLITIQRPSVLRKRRKRNYFIQIVQEPPRIDGKATFLVTFNEQLFISGPGHLLCSRLLFHSKLFIDKEGGLYKQHAWKTGCEILRTGVNIYQRMFPSPTTNPWEVIRSSVCSDTLYNSADTAISRHYLEIISVFGHLTQALYVATEWRSPEISCWVVSCCECDYAKTFCA